jgi:hypothetical protein
LPVLRQHIALAARGFRAFLNLEAGLTRGEIPVAGDQVQKLRQAEQRIEKQREQIERQSREFKELRARVSEGVNGLEPGGIRPENIVWIFGTGRTGSTWLAFMMEELERHAVWREPYVGELFGRLHYNWTGEKHFETKHFILGRHKESWLKSVRSFVLNEASARFPGVAGDGYLVVKEPHGSLGAPLLMEALPESRMIFLIRDPRDVVASSVEAHSKGSWLYKRRVEQGGGRTAMFDMQTDALVENRANTYLQNVGNAKEAYDAHKGPKVLVRYEDLRADTLGVMKRIYSVLGIGVSENELTAAVKKHAWEKVPEEQKGEGKFHRKAKPGGWREDLTEEQAETVERITAPLLEEFYP